MMQENKFSFRKRVRSFTYAFNGIWSLIRQEHNARIHCLALVCVVIAGIAFRINRMEWIAIAIVSGSVWATEALNTALERLSDHVCPEKHPAIQQTKDMAAAAVLITAIVALIVGSVIFIPKVVKLFS